MPAAVAALAALVAVFLALPIHLRPWSAFDLVAMAQAEVRRRMPAADAPIFLDQADARTDIHATGRSDLRAVCGWMTTSGSEERPRFFYVLYERGLLDLSSDEVFIQTRPDEASPHGGESWCRSPALPGAGPDVQPRPLS